MNNNNYNDDRIVEEIRKSASEAPIPATLSPNAMRQQLYFRQESRKLYNLKRICVAAVAIVLLLGGGFAAYRTLGGFISPSGSNSGGSNNNSGNAELTLSTESQCSDSQNQAASGNNSESSSGLNSDGTNSEQTSSAATAKNATVGDKYHLASGSEEVYAVLATMVSSNYITSGTSAWVEEEIAVGSMDSVPDSSSDGSYSSDESTYSSTNTMVENVDEGDLVKINDEYIYMIAEEDHSGDYVEGSEGDMWYDTDISNHITIFRIEDGNMKRIGTLDCCPSNTSYIQEIYLDSDRLYVIYSEYYRVSSGENQSGTNSDSEANADSDTDDANNDTDSDESSTDTYYAYSYRTGLLAYDVSDAKNPQQIGHITQDGEYYTSRKTGDYIYLFSKNRPSSSCDDDTWIEEDLLPEVNGTTVSYDSIYLPTKESDTSGSSDSDCLYTGYRELIISSIYIGGDTVDTVTDSLVIVNDDSVYMSEDAIYLYSTEYLSDNNAKNDDNNTNDENETGEGGNDSDTSGEQEDSAEYGDWVTAIAKFTYEDGILNAVNSATVAGQVTDKFALHESDGIFQILTTSYSYEYTYGSNGVLEDMESTPSNQLYLFDSSMQQLGSLEGIAEGEEIYAARYIGDIVYFITYLNTDPLFAVDISDPSNPTLLGQLEITGFSDYLHPFGDGLLLGIGYETDPDTGVSLGVKLIMFDISDPTDLTVLDTVVLENADYTSAAYYYKTVLVDPEKNIIGFTHEGYDDSSIRFHTYYNVYEWNEEGFTQVLQTEVTTYNSDIVRGLYSGDYLYVIGRFGDILTLSSYDMDDAYCEIDTLLCNS